MGAFFPGDGPSSGISVTLTAGTLQAIRERVGKRGVSAYLEKAAQRQIEGDNLDELIADFDQVNGPADPEAVASTSRHSAPQQALPHAIDVSVLCKNSRLAPQQNVRQTCVENASRCSPVTHTTHIMHTRRIRRSATLFNRFKDRNALHVMRHREHVRLEPRGGNRQVRDGFEGEIQTPPRASCVIRASPPRRCARRARLPIDAVTTGYAVTGCATEAQ